MKNKNEKFITHRKILVVDDEPALFAALVDKFTRAGFTVLMAKNGQEGLQVAFTHRPDIILLDIIMPVMDGMEMLCELRKDIWGKYVKVILLTNLSDPEKINKSLDEKANGYLLKSDWKIDDVVKQVCKKLAE